MIATQNGKQPPVEFADRGLFLDVLHGMREGGFGMFSQVAIGTADLPYRDPEKRARITEQFYWAEGKQLIIKLSHHEHTEQDGQQTRMWSQWNVDVYLGFIRSWDGLVDLAPGGDVNRIPFFNTGHQQAFAPEGLVCCGGSYSGMEKLVEANFYFNSRIEYVSPACIVSAAVAIKNMTSKYLRPLPFAELWVHSFPPSYHFPECEELFWSRFDKRNLRSLVTCPHGSPGLKR